MDNIIKFENNNFGTVRTIEVDGIPYFVGKDVAMALGYSNVRDAIAKHVDDEDKGVAKCDTLGGKQNLTVINESGVYSLVFGSKLPTAKQFKHWVTSEILPSIRKTGGYVANSELFVNNYFSGVNTQQRALLTAMLEASKQQSETIKIMKPKAEYCDKILMSKDVITPTEMGKLFGMSAQRFHKTANDLGLMYKVGKNWVLYKKFQNKGYTKVRTYCDCAGHPS